MSTSARTGSPSSLDELATPFLYVDLDRMTSNIDTMAAAARALGVRLRPHVKTHKVPELARLQIAAGATGVTVAKVSEAEVFADAGIDDLFVAYQVVAPAPLERLVRLARRAHVRCAVDSHEGAELLSRAATAAGVALEVWGRAEGEALVSAATDLRAIAVPIAEVSAGSTPTALPAGSVRGVTEIRPGQYLFGCANIVAQGAMRADEVALFARATVISRPADDRAVVDAGSKTLSTDGPWEPGRGFGYLASDPSTRVVSMWEEHGVLGLGERARGLRVGDRVSIVPNHVCTTINLHDRIVGVHDDRIETVWKIAARGRIE